jgi:hypothetical protein
MVKQTCNPPGGRAVGDLVVAADGREHLAQPLTPQVGLVNAVQNYIHHLQTRLHPMVRVFCMSNLQCVWYPRV